MFSVQPKSSHIWEGISSIEEKNNAVFVFVQQIKLIHIMC